MLINKAVISILKYPGGRWGIAECECDVLFMLPDNVVALIIIEVNYFTGTTVEILHKVNDVA